MIQNVFQDPKETIWHQVHYTDSGQAFVHEMRRIKGKFYETMELNDFPFDVQVRSFDVQVRNFLKGNSV